MNKIDNIIQEAINNFLQEDLQTNIIAYHGTPHNFIKFQTKNIGTGEGNQSFGYGLYFTSNKDVASFYAKTIGKGQGNIYTVQIKDGIFFNWYEKLDEDFKMNFIKKMKQSNITEMPIKRILSNGKLITKNAPIEDAIEYFPNGKFFYENLSLMMGNDKKTSQFLQSLGFIGIIYSIGQFLNKGTMMHGNNYVIFNDEDVTIINKEHITE